jgi:hypothetical protein
MYQIDLMPLNLSIDFFSFWKPFFIKMVNPKHYLSIRLSLSNTCGTVTTSLQTSGIS